MGEAQQWLFEPSFNRAVKVQAGDERITSDSGLLLLREADERLGLTEWLANRLDDPRDPNAVRYQLVELLRQRLYALAMGYSAQDDADRLAHDPAMKMAAWDRPGERTVTERLASQPTQSRLMETLTLTTGNRAALRDALGESCIRHLRTTGSDQAARKITIDIDSFPIQVHGRQVRRRLQRPLQGDGLSSARGQLLGGRPLRQHARRPPAGQRISARRPAARTSAHGAWCPAVSAASDRRGGTAGLRSRLSHRRRLHRRRNARPAD